MFFSLFDAVGVGDVFPAKNLQIIISDVNHIVIVDVMGYFCQGFASLDVTVAIIVI